MIVKVFILKCTTKSEISLNGDVYGTPIINMEYNEAIRYKDEAIKNADQSVLEHYHIIVVPADTEEGAKYIEEYSKHPGSFKDESCKKYCSNGEYLVVSFKKYEP